MLRLQTRFAGANRKSAGRGRGKGGSAPPPPVWVQQPSPSFTAGVAGSLNIANMVTGETSITIVGSLPAWLTFDGTTLSSSNQSLAGSYGPFYFIASNNTGTTPSSNFNVVIAATSPVWATMSPYSVYQTTAAGPFLLPVTVAGGGSITVTWSPLSNPSSQPNWIVLTSGTAPTIYFNGNAQQLDAADVSSMILTATTTGGSSNSGSTTVTVLPVAVSTGDIWGQSIGFFDGQWTQLRRDRSTRVTQSVVSNQAERNAPWAYTRDMGPGYNQNDGRIWFGHGNGREWGSLDDGFADSSSDSNNVGVFSAPISNLHLTCREAGWPRSDISESYTQRLGGWSGVDPYNNKYLCPPASGFGAEFDQAYTGREKLTVTYWNGSTTIRFVRPIATLPVNTKLRLWCTVDGYTDCPFDARVVSATDLGAGSVEVVFTPRTTEFFALTDITSVTGVNVSDDPESGSYHWFIDGAWQDAQQQAFYKKSTGKFYFYMEATDCAQGAPAGGKQQRMWFELTSRTTPFCANAGAVMSPTSTGRGWELWLWGGPAGDVNMQYITCWDLQAKTCRWWNVATGTPNRNSSGGYNFGCGDNAGNLYLYGPESNGLHYVNIRGTLPAEGSTLSVTIRTPTYSSPLVIATAQNKTFTYAMVWNEDLQMIEMYALHDNPTHTLGVGLMTLFLIEPATGTTYKIADTDRTGTRIITSMPTAVPSGTGLPQKTLLLGGTGDATRIPDKLNIFIGGNLDWQNLTLGNRFHAEPVRRDIGGQNAGDARATDSATITSVQGLYYAQYGSVVSAVDSSGLPTGEFLARLGGDADYIGCEVHRAFLNAYDGTTLPVRTLNATDSTTAQLWKNRVKCGQGFIGGTTGTSEVLVNKDDYTQWTPLAGHHYAAVSYLPNFGWVQNGWAPLTLPIAAGSTDDVDQPYAGQTDLKLFGYLSHGFVRGSAKVASSLIGWNVTTGLWEKLTPSNSHAGCYWMADWNPSTSKLLYGYNQTLYEWNGVTGATPSSKSFPYVLGLGTAAYWLEGNDYLITPYNGGGGIAGASATDGRVIRWNNTTNTATVLTGNSILESSRSNGCQMQLIMDRPRRIVYWMVGVPPRYNQQWSVFRLYRSSYDDLLNLTEVPTKSRNTLDKYWVDSTWGAGVKNAYVYGDFLWAMPKKFYNDSFSTAAAVWRLPIY